MTEQTDFLKEAVAAMEDSQHALESVVENDSEKVLASAVRVWGGAS